MKKAPKLNNSTEQVGSLKRSTDCKGHRPHNLVLVLPPYIGSRIDETSLTLGQIEAYYEYEEGRMRADKHYDDLINDLFGTSALRGWCKELHRYYQCTVCGKKE